MVVKDTAFYPFTCEVTVSVDHVNKTCLSFDRLVSKKRKKMPTDKTFWHLKIAVLGLPEHIVEYMRALSNKKKFLFKI